MRSQLAEGYPTRLVIVPYWKDECTYQCTSGTGQIIEIDQKGSKPIGSDGIADRRQGNTVSIDVVGNGLNLDANIWFVALRK